MNEGTVVVMGAMVTLIWGPFLLETLVREIRVLRRYYR